MFEKLNFSWVIPEFLAASAVPTSKKDFEFLVKKQNIEVIITLTENNLNKYIKNYRDIKSNYVFKQYHIPTVDGTGFYSHQFEKISKIVEENMQKNNRILIHCEGGYGRTSTALAAVWMKLYNKNLEQTVEELKQDGIRPQVIFTDIQVQSLKEWEKYLFHK